MATRRGRAPVAKVEPVEPYRPLAMTGRRLWDEVHEQGAVRGSLEPLLLLCERLDERQRVRLLIEQRPDETAHRIGLRALEAQIVEDFERLGIRSLLPVGTAVVADDWTVTLAAVRG